MNLHGLISEDSILPNMVARDKRAAIHELIEFVKDRKGLSEETARKTESARNGWFWPSYVCLFF